MSAPRVSRPAGGAHIFPFLAVLICTMGALVTLLVVISQHARTRGMQEGARRRAAVENKAPRQRPDEIARLQSVQRNMAEQLAERRLQLSHLEDHVRRLREKLGPLQKSLKDLERAGSETTEREDATKSDLARLKQQIVDAQAELADAERNARNRPASYSVVPYTGPNQTRRRPIYFECLEDMVVLQPEGIVFTPSDFEGPLGPSNPLAAAARAVREYWISRLPPDASERVEPYPLLLVRPQGVEAYYAARAALQSWGAEFGYELIAQDWNLTYPKEDRELSQLLAQVIDAARIAQMRAIAAAPIKYKRPRGGVVATPHHGGFAPLRGGGRRQGSGSRSTGSATGGGFGQQGSFSSSGLAARGNGRGRTSLGAGGDSVLGLTGNGSGLDPGSGPPGSSGGSGGSAAYGARGGQSSPQGGHGGLSGGGGSGTSSAALVGDGGEPRASGSGNQSSSGIGYSGERFTSDASAGGQAGSSGVNDGSSGGGGQLGYAGGDSDSPGGGSGGGMSAHGGNSSPHGSNKSIADKRGDNWGLPDAAQGAIAVTRPVVLECRTDMLLIVPDVRYSRPAEVALGQYTEDSIDELIASLWKHMKGWGTAGRGLYWRPTLVVHVAEGADGRYEELRTLLAGSGFEVTRRQPPAASAPTAPTQIRR